MSSPWWIVGYLFFMDFAYMLPGVSTNPTLASRVSSSFLRTAARSIPCRFSSPTIVGLSSISEPVILFLIFKSAVKRCSPSQILRITHVSSVNVLPAMSVTRMHGIYALYITVLIPYHVGTISPGSWCPPPPSCPPWPPTRAAGSCCEAPAAAFAPHAACCLMKGSEGFDPSTWRSEAARTIQAVLRVRREKIFTCVNTCLAS